MTFNSVRDSFNYYNAKSLQELETRAAEIKGELDFPNADLMSLNIEIEGLEQAMKNKQELEQTQDSEAPSERAIPVDSYNVAEKCDDVLSSKEYRSAFFKNLLGQPLTLREKSAFRQGLRESRSDEYLAGDDASAVLPTQTLNEVISKSRSEGGLISLARQFSTPANLSIPIGTPHNIASWNEEGHDVDREKVELDSVKFNAYEIIKVFSISNRVKAMSIPAFESYLTEELSHCVMSCVANSLINGNGSNEGTGLMNIAQTEENKVDVKGDLSYADIVKIIGLLKRGYQAGSVFIMNNYTLWNHIYNLVDAANRPLFILDAQKDQIGRILGFPVIVDDYLENDKIIFGNPSYCAFNLVGFSVESSTQSSFTSGKIDYRCQCIADCKPLIDEAFVFCNITPAEEMMAEDLKGIVKVKGN